MKQLTFSQLRQLIRRESGVQWVFLQNKTVDGERNFTQDSKIPDRYWNGDWTKPPVKHFDKIAHWLPSEGQLYVGIPSTADRKKTKEGRVKIPMDSVTAYKISDYSPVNHSLMALLSSEVNGLGDQCTYWPKNSDTKNNAHQAIKTIAVAEGEMTQRLAWVRKNHYAFRDPVWAHWQGKCAVTRSECNGALIASHIFPWSKSDSKQKTDVNNGLLLAVPFDALFDRGLISFGDTGELLVGSELTPQTAKIFGINKGMRLDDLLLTKQMKMYLALHRKQFKYR